MIMQRTMKITIKKISTIISLVFITSFLSSCATVDGQKAVKKRNPNFKQAAELNVKLAVGYIQRKEYKPAKDKLLKAIEQDPDYLPGYKTLAYLYAFLGLTDKAENMYDEASDISPDDSDLLNSHGAFLCSINKLDEAQEKLSAAYKNPFYETAYLAESNAGSCYIKSGEYRKAERLLRKSLRVKPDIPGSLISMAEVGVKTERFLMARAYIQRYHSVHAVSAESLWIQAQAERALGAKDHYMKIARQLVKDFPDSDESGWVEAQARNEQFKRR